MVECPQKERECCQCKSLNNVRMASDKYYYCNKPTCCLRNSVCGTPGCGSDDYLKISKRSGGPRVSSKGRNLGIPTGGPFCWLCRFKFEKKRDPTRNDQHKVPINKILANPKEYVTFTGGYPGSVSGNLLAWLILQTNKHSYENIYCVEIINAKYYHKFNPEDFNFSFCAEYGEIEEIEENISRFIMKNGGIYKVVKIDGEYYQTHLEYVHPISDKPILNFGLRSIMQK